MNRTLDQQPASTEEADGSARACGPDHAAIFAWTEAERRRIRRAIAPALRQLSAARLLNRPPPWTMEVLAKLADTINRATKAPRGKVRR